MAVASVLTLPLALPGSCYIMMHSACAIHHKTMGFGLAWPSQKDRAGERESVVLTKLEPALLRV